MAVQFGTSVRSFADLIPYHHKVVLVPDLAAGIALESSEEMGMAGGG